MRLLGADYRLIADIDDPPVFAPAGRTKGTLRYLQVLLSTGRLITVPLGKGWFPTRLVLRLGRISVSLSWVYGREIHS